MKNLLVFTAWVLGSTLTAVIPAAIISLLTPATYQDVMTCSAYVAITFIFGTCLVGVAVAQEVYEYLYESQN